MDDAPDSRTSASELVHDAVVAALPASAFRSPFPHGPHQESSAPIDGRGRGTHGGSHDEYDTDVTRPHLHRRYRALGRKIDSIWMIRREIPFSHCGPSTAFWKVSRKTIAFTIATIEDERLFVLRLFGNSERTYVNTPQKLYCSIESNHGRIEEMDRPRKWAARINGRHPARDPHLH